ncbi:MAG: MBL fold metallo-hydrolase [Clostridiales bacterium]|nr:MBL fold metallo-hydrolase [Clostridiales bacterium]
MTTIQPTSWRSALPRPEYRSYERIVLAADQGWYEVYRVLPDIYAICEPGHFQEVISFLIVGAERALLWDTGMGVAPILPVAEALTGLPIVAVNSHDHFDHVGGNWEFPAVYGWSEAAPARLAVDREYTAQLARASMGYSREFLAPMMGEDSLAKPLPAAFDKGGYRIRPWRKAALLQPSPPPQPPSPPQPPPPPPPPSQPSQQAQSPSQPSQPSPQQPAARLFTGAAFDLGGRLLEVLATPGHSPDSIMLLDRQAGVLFTGDTVYPAALYAHFDSAEYGKSSVADYAATMASLQELAPSLTKLCCSHNVPVNPPELLPDVAEGFRRIQSGQSEGITGSDGLIRHNFRGFSIIISAR